MLTNVNGFFEGQICTYLMYKVLRFWKILNFVKNEGSAVFWQKSEYYICKIISHKGFFFYDHDMIIELRKTWKGVSGIGGVCGWEGEFGCMKRRKIVAMLT